MKICTKCAWNKISKTGTVIAFCFWLKKYLLNAKWESLVEKWNGYLFSEVKSNAENSQS